MRKGERICVDTYFKMRNKNEDGRIMVLSIALVAFIAAFVFISASVTYVHVQKNRLQACADSLSKIAAGSVRADSYYTGNGMDLYPPGGRLVRRKVESVLQVLADTSCKVGEGVTLVSVDTQENETFVILSAQSVLPLVPTFISGVVAPVLTVESSAKIR